MINVKVYYSIERTGVNTYVKRISVNRNQSVSR